MCSHAFSISINMHMYMCLYIYGTAAKCPWSKYVLSVAYFHTVV